MTRDEMDRRAALKAFVGLGLASGLADCTSAPEPGGAPAPTEQPPAADTTPSEEHEHPVDGDVLVFMPGAYEIRRTIEAAQAKLARLGELLDFRPLHGSLSAREQDAAIAPGPRRA